MDFTSETAGTKRSSSYLTSRTLRFGANTGTRFKSFMPTTAPSIRLSPGPTGRCVFFCAHDSTHIENTKLLHSIMPTARPTACSSSVHAISSAGRISAARAMFPICAVSSMLPTAASAATSTLPLVLDRPFLTHCGITGTCSSSALALAALPLPSAAIGWRCLSDSLSARGCARAAS